MRKETDSMIATLFPRSVVTVVADRAMWADAPHPEEAEFVRDAVAKRRREFAAGRSCARQALNILGVEPQPVLVGQHREPLWPKGVVGSLTHSRDYCAAAVARAQQFAGLGVDAEASEALDPDLISTVCTPAEIAWAEKNRPPQSGDWPKIIFSAKESVYKCLFPLVRRVLSHQEIEIQLQPSQRRFDVQLLFETPAVLKCLPAMVGRFHVGPDNTVTGVVLEQPGSAASRS